MGNINNWKKVKLGDVCIVKRGSSPRPIEKFITKDKNGINWIKIGDTSLNSKYIIHTAQKIIPEGMNKSCFVQAGDFLLSNSMSFGRPYILKIDGCIHDGWLVLKDTKNLFNKIFLYYYLSSPSVYNRFKHMAVGGVVNNLNSEMVKKLDLPLASPDEQKRIADILDKATELIALRKQQIEKLDLLVKSRFIEMFGNSVINKWEKITIEECCSKIVDCPHSTPLYCNDGHYPCIRTSDLVNGYLTLSSSTKYVNNIEYIKRIQRYKPTCGDIIYSREGERFGIAAIIPKELFVCLGQRIMLFSPQKSIVTSEYLCGVLNSNIVYEQAKNSVGGATSPHVNMKDIKLFTVPYPPLSLQKEFTTFIKQVDKTKSTLQKSLEKLELNYKALMQTYFG